MLHAVDDLRHVVAVRTGRQHTGGRAMSNASAGRVALRIERFGSEWYGAWEQLRHVTVAGLTAIREEIEPLLP